MKKIITSSLIAAAVAFSVSGAFASTAQNTKELAEKCQNAANKDSKECQEFTKQSEAGKPEAAQKAS